MNITDVEKAAKSAARRLPPPAQRALRTGYRAVRPVKVVPPPQPTVDYPPVVADADSLRDYLRDTDLFGPAQAEADGYLYDALERFRVTMALLPKLQSDAKILELGANPYFLTRLLLKEGYDVTAANYFGPKSGFGEKGEQVVTGPVSGEQHTFRFDHFNIEDEPFPYDNDTFDVVLFCEILEHLPADPIHTLAQIHRVLKPGGSVIITTPNASRLENLVEVLRGGNMYESISGYGTYGRHNREYTVQELTMLLEELGFEPQQVVAMDIHEHAHLWGDVPAGANPENRGCNLFAVARAQGDFRYRYPDWLYQSKHGLHRVVRPDLVMGYNDDVQSGGFHALEQSGDGWFRWMGAQPQATVTLPNLGSDKGELVVEGYGAPIEAGGTITLTATTADGSSIGSWDITSDTKQFSVGGPMKLPSDGDVTVHLSTNRTWSPADLGISEDARQLSVAVTKVAVRPEE